MSKGGGGSAPEAPDPNVTAAAQAKYGKETALFNSALNNVNQITPYGSLSWELTQGKPEYNYEAYNKALDSYNNWTPEIVPANALGYGSKRTERPPMPELNNYQTNSGDLPQWTSTVNLSPEMQAIFDSQMRQQDKLGQLSENALGQVENAYATPYSYDNINQLYGSDDLNDARLRTEEAIYSRLNPQFDRDEEAMRTRLINQGIAQGSEAYNTEMERFNQMKNDARMQAVLAGGTESDRLFNQSLTARQQGITELDRLRSQPLNEYLAMSGQQQLTTPQFQQYNYAGAPTPDYQGAVQNQYQSQLANYNSQQASKNNALGALFSLGGAAVGGMVGGPAGAKAGYALGSGAGSLF